MRFLSLVVLLAGCASTSAQSPTPQTAPQRFSYWRCRVVETRWAPDRNAFLRSQSQALEVTYDCEGRP